MTNYNRLFQPIREQNTNFFSRHSTGPRNSSVFGVELCGASCEEVLKMGEFQHNRENNKKGEI